MGLLCLSIGAFGCQRVASVPTERPILRIGNAFAPLSVPIIAEFQKALPNLDVRLEQTPESRAVVLGIQKGTVDLGVVLADVAYAAYWNAAGKRSQQADEVRGVALLPPLAVYLIARPGSGIHNAGDLQHRNIAVGPKYTSSWVLAHLLLKKFGIEATSIRALNTRGEAAAGLKDGTLDAVFFPGYVYPDEETYAAIREGAYLVPIDGDGVERMRAENPFVREVSIPRNIYPGQNRVVPTVALEMVLVCRGGLDNAIVYQATKQFFASFPRVAGVEALLRFFNVDQAPATPIPLHPGATRYFRERELSR